MGLKRRLRLGLQLGAIATTMLFLAGCHIDMWVQPKVKPQQESEFYLDKRASRTPVKNTIAVGNYQDDDAYFKGVVDGKYVKDFPPRALEQFGGSAEKMLKRGQDRFNVFCTPCHGRIGDGKGMIAQRGLALKREPATYHTDRLRDMPVGHFYDVIVNGFGVMFPYDYRIQDPADRWAIVAYIRALQYSQHVTKDKLETEDMTKVDSGATKKEQE